MDDDKGGFGVKTVFEVALRKSGVLVGTKGEEDNMGKNNNQGYNGGTSKSATEQDKDKRREKLIEKILSEDEKEELSMTLKEYFSGKDNFFEEEKKVNTKYLDIYVRVLAYQFLEEKDKLSQLRNFYNEVERADRALTLDDKYDFKKCIYNLRNMAVYKCSSGDVGKQFCNFMEHSRKIIHSKDDFSVFKMHFEGILCYFPREKGDK